MLHSTVSGLVSLVDFREDKWLHLKFRGELPMINRVHPHGLSQVLDVSLESIGAHADLRR